MSQVSYEQLAARTGQVEMILRQIDSLPTLAPVAMRLMRIGNVDDADLDEIVDLIEADPPLTARLLAICQRADKGLGDRITTLRRAVVMLGLESVQAAALSVAVFEVMQSCSPSLDDELSPRSPAARAIAEAAFDRAGFWRHCIAVATASERIAAAHPAYGVRPEEAFVAGLLHDLGKLVLHTVLPRSYARVLGAAERRHCSSAEIEPCIFGMDHHAAGRRIAEHWGLPDALRDCLWLRASAAAGLEAIPEVPHRKLIVTVSLARTMCRHFHLGWCGDFNHPEPLDGPHGLCEQSRGLDPRTLQRCADGLHEAVAARARALGLDESEAPELLMQSLGAANRRLGRLSTDLRSRMLTAHAQVGALDAITALHQSGQRSLLETLAALVGSATRAFGRGFYATVHQMRPGDTWHISAFSSDGRPLRSHPIDTPHDRETGRCRSLAELGRSSTTLNAMGALPWLADHLIDAQDLGRIQLLALASTASGPAAILLHDSPPLADKHATEALIASWAAAFSAAAHHENARRFADQLASANRALAEAESKMAEMQSLARMGEMAAGAAHEMNNPLAVISGRAELLAELASTDADRETASAIVDAASRLSDLITAISTIAAPPAPAPTLIPISEMLETAVLRARAKLGDAPRQMNIQTRADQPNAQVLIDRELVITSLAELIANALEAAPDGKVLVQAQITPSDGRLILSVHDDGAGMSPRAQQHAFDPFFSEHPAGRRSGLGLTRARRFIELVGGHLRLQSQPGAGTMASIEVPQDDALCPDARRLTVALSTMTPHTRPDTSLEAA